MLKYPMYYHDKNQEVWLTLKPCCYGKYAKRHKIFQSRFLKMAAITLSNFKWPQLQYFLDDSLHLNTKIISRICSFQNCIYLKIPQKLVSTGFVRVGHKWSRRSRFSFKRTANRNISHSVYTDGSITKDQTGWDFTVKQGVTTIHENSVANTVSTSSLTMEVEAVTMPSAGLPQEVTVWPHMPSFWQIQWACYKKWKVEWEAQTGMCRWSTSTFEKTRECTALDMLEWRKMTEQIDRPANQPLQEACFSEDLKCWGAWDTTRGYKATGITPSIAWMRETWKEEALDDLPWTDERGPWSIRRALEPFQRRHWGNVWETLNWTEL